MQVEVYLCTFLRVIHRNLEGNENFLSILCVLLLVLDKNLFVSVEYFCDLKRKIKGKHGPFREIAGTKSKGHGKLDWWIDSGFPIFDLEDRF